MSAGEPLISTRPFAVTKCLAWLMLNESPAPHASSPVILKSATVSHPTLLSSSPYKWDTKNLLQFHTPLCCHHLHTNGTQKICYNFTPHSAVIISVQMAHKKSATISHPTLLSSSPYKWHTKNTNVTDTLCSKYCGKMKQTCRNVCIWSSGECNGWLLSRHEPPDATTSCALYKK